MEFKITRELIRAILQSPFDLKWSVQGLGMLRTYLGNDQVYRLHIWDSNLRVPNVSPIHDHPWHLDSLIISGKLRQKRYHIGGITSEICFLNGGLVPTSEIFQMVSIKCGEGACTKTEPIAVKAYSRGLEVYNPGQNYFQFKTEVHESLAVDGTVTLVKRTFDGDRDTARVFWRGEGQWVDAEPRRATVDEIKEVTRRALRGFDEA